LAVFKKVQAGLPAVRRGSLTQLRRGETYRSRVIRTVLDVRAGQEVDLTLSGRRHLFFLPLLGPHQHDNLACAMAGLDQLQQAGYACSEAARVAGVARVRWPGRLQMAGLSPRLLLDGAHNPAGSLALAKALAKLKRGRVGLVVGVLKDKNWQGILKPLLPLVNRIFMARPQDEADRGLDPQVALAWLKGRSAPRADAFSSISSAFLASRRWAKKNDTLVVAGSLYSVGEVLRHLKKASKY
jgi:dihydrofolate synthase/folylpolyglutamate synthase